MQTKSAMYLSIPKEMRTVRNLKEFGFKKNVIVVGIFLDNAVLVAPDVFYSTCNYEAVIVEGMNGGCIHKYFTTDYALDKQDNVLYLIDKHTNVRTQVSFGNTFYFGSLKVSSGWTPIGSGKYKALHYTDYMLGELLIRFHTLIKGFYVGHLALDTMGSDRTLEPHHGDREILNNSHWNIEFLTHDEHVEVHRKLRELDKLNKMLSNKQKLSLFLPVFD